MSDADTSYLFTQALLVPPGYRAPVSTQLLWRAYMHMDDGTVPASLGELAQLERFWSALPNHRRRRPDVLRFMIRCRLSMTGVAFLAKCAKAAS